MRIPVVCGVIDRRILANFRVDSGVMARNLPRPFRPKLAGGFSMVGICLIRLKKIRPRFVPLPWGLRSKNAAHRVAVQWNDDGQIREGVFIPRRDTDSRLNTWAGGRIFPGMHHHANFTVDESDQHLSIAMTSDDRSVKVVVSGTITDRLPTSSVFSSLSDASEFFQRGSLGYSVTRTAGRFDGLELRCKQWRVEALDVDRIESSFFENESMFPAGSVEFDCALLMRDIEHLWHSHEDLVARA